jgi:hypothetical protein
LNGTFHLSPHENILTIALTNIHYLYTVHLYRVYQKNRNLGISQDIDIVLKTKDFRRLGI